MKTVSILCTKPPKGTAFTTPKGLKLFQALKNIEKNKKGKIKEGKKTDKIQNKGGCRSLQCS